jgi:hypothetical protein
LANTWKRARGARRRAARDRRVDPPAAGPLAQPRGEAATALDLDRREIDDACRRRDAARHAVLAEHRLLDRVGGRQVEQHEAGAARRIGGRHGGPRTRGHRGGEAFGHHFVRTDRPAARGESRDHRPAHQADADVAEDGLRGCTHDVSPIA